MISCLDALSIVVQMLFYTALCLIALKEPLVFRVWVFRVWEDVTWFWKNKNVSRA